MSYITKSSFPSHINSALASGQPIDAAMLRQFMTDILDSFIHKDDLPINLSSPSAGQNLQFDGNNWVNVVTGSIPFSRAGNALNSSYIAHADCIGKTSSTFALFVDSVFKGFFSVANANFNATNGRFTNIDNLEAGFSFIILEVNPS